MRREFERTAPEAVGIPSGAVERLLDALEGSGHTQMHGLMIMRHGKICAEGYWSPFSAAQVHADYSLSKTYTATAVGICEYKGMLSLDQKVMDYFPEALPEAPGEWLKQLTIRDLMMMGGGFPQEQRGYPADWIARHLGAEMEHEPGTFWRYDSHGSTLLAAIVERVTGMSMMDWLNQNLFQIIGIDEKRVMCRKTADGVSNGGGGMFTTAEDNLRLMKLYLEGGVWEGERVLSEQFVRSATSRQIDNQASQAAWIYDNRMGYGYQMWMCRPEASYRADGAFGQFCVVVPSEDLIVSIFESAYNGGALSTSDLHLPEGQQGEVRSVYGPQITLDLLFGILLPEVRQDPLPEKPAEAYHLAERMRRLSMPPAWGQLRPDWTAHLPACELQAQGQGISLNPTNPMTGSGQQMLYADHLSLREENGCLHLTAQCGDTVRELLADMNGGRTQGRLPTEGEILSKVSCSAWIANDGRLCLSVLWYETVLEHLYTFEIGEKSVRVVKKLVQGGNGSESSEEAEYKRIL